MLRPITSVISTGGLCLDRVWNKTGAAPEYLFIVITGSSGEAENTQTRLETTNTNISPICCSGEANAGVYVQGSHLNGRLA
jgi:hypothetical protein